MEPEWQSAIIKPWDGLHNYDYLNARKAATGTKLLVSDQRTRECVTCGAPEYLVKPEVAEEVRSRHGLRNDSFDTWICSSEVLTD